MNNLDNLSQEDLCRIGRRGIEMKYRKKSVIIIDAFQYWGSINNKNVPMWVLDLFESGDIHYGKTARNPEEGLLIDMPACNYWYRVNIGDYIIKDENGNISGCIPELFEQMYEEVK